MDVQLFDQLVEAKASSEHVVLRVRGGGGVSSLTVRILELRQSSDGIRVHVYDSANRNHVFVDLDDVLDVERG